MYAVILEIVWIVFVFYITHTISHRESFIVKNFLYIHCSMCMQF